MKIRILRVFFVGIYACFMGVLAYGQTQVAPFVNSHVQFSNASGAAPCNGCLLDTFAAGTTTPLATYSESTGTTPNSNPVVLGSDGSAVVYLTNASYKFRLRTAAGATIWTQDNVSAVNFGNILSSLTLTGNATINSSTAATNVANQSGPTLCMDGNFWNGSASAVDSWCWNDVLGTGTNPTSTLTLVHSGSSGTPVFSVPALSASSVSVSGAVAAGAAAIKNTPFIDPVAWGADPTGVADSTTAWTNALAQASSSGVEIRCQAGTYKIISTLTFGTNYGIVADGKSCILKAGAVMTNMATLGGTAPPPYNKGYMRGIQFNGNSLAAHAMFLGCSGVSCSTQFVNGYKFDAVLVYNMTGDGTQSGNNVWANVWINFAFMNNGGNGYTLTGGNNSGEGITFINGSFGNNLGWGLAIGNPGTGGQSVFLHGVTFDQNNLGQLQNCTSVSNGCVVSGTMHFEYNSLLTTTRQIQNFGQFTCTGCMFTGGTGNSTYQIDNEGSMLLKGGFWANGGSGTTFNAAQTGTTVVQEVANMPTEAPMDSFCDTADDCNFKHPIFFNSSASTAVNVPNGGIHAGSTIASDSGLKPASSGPSITGDGTNVILPQTKLTGSVLGNGGSILSSQTAPTIAAAGCGGAAATLTPTNGTAVFTVTVGTTPGSACTVTMPAATNDWVCSATDVSTNSTAVFLQKVQALSATSILITNYNDVAVATAFTASDKLKVLCSGE